MSCIIVTITRYDVPHPMVRATARLSMGPIPGGTYRSIAYAEWPQEEGVSARDTLRNALSALTEALDAATPPPGPRAP